MQGKPLYFAGQTVVFWRDGAYREKLSANALEMNGFLLFDGQKGQMQRKGKCMPRISEKAGYEKGKILYMPRKLENDRN